MQAELLKRITVIPGLMSGKPTISGMQFPVKNILEMLASGKTNEDILEQHPSLEKEDIQAALHYASLIVNSATAVKESETV